VKIPKKFSMKPPRIQFARKSKQPITGRNYYMYSHRKSTGTSQKFI